MTEPNATTQEPPAGGLDMPPLKMPSENESFPGESQLTDDERNRWLILHFALPRTIMTQDMEEGLTTEQELNNVLASMAWGTIDRETSEFILEFVDPTLDAPHSSLISYAEYMDRTYPVDPQMDDEVREENFRMARKKKITCTHPGEPVAKFKPMFDQVVKNLVHSNKALAKAFDIKKAILDENDVPEDPEAEAEMDDQHIILRYGRYQVIPAFFNLLIQLTKEKRRFSIVFRTFSADQLPGIQREMKLFCETRHPAYSGQNKTQKPPLMSGDKLSRDMRLADENIGCVSRVRILDENNGHLEFPKRQADGPPAEPEIGEDGLPIPPPFVPTRYEFPAYHQAYEGLLHEVLEKTNSSGQIICNTAAIVDDHEYWKEQDKAAAAGKLFLVNHGGGYAETKVQHIFFDGHIQAGNAHCVDVRDATTGEPVPYAQAEDIFMHRVDFYQACLDSEYFIKALKNCETKMSKAILESRRVPGDIVDSDECKEALDGLPPKEYLYRTVIPALLPALEACQRDRPADPIEFIAFYMLRHTHQYSKTLKA